MRRGVDRGTVIGVKPTLRHKVDVPLIVSRSGIGHTEVDALQVFALQEAQRLLGSSVHVR